MKAYADLELSLHKRSGNIYTVEARYSPAGSEADIRIGEQEGIEIRIDFEALQRYAVGFNMESYGRLLTEALFSSVQVKNFFAQAVSDAGTEPLRLRLLFGSTAENLHGIYWETLRSPIDDTLLAANENILFSRYLASDTWKAARPRPKRKIRALVAIANPSGLSDYQLSPVNVPDELERIQKNLRGFEIKTLPDDLEKCTLDNLATHIREGYDILYLVAHGKVDKERNPWLFLENQAGTVERVSGKELADQIRGMRTPPLLVILASCESAGEGTGRTLQALGPLLSGAGVPAVVAMQGEISTDSVSRMMPVFFKELQKDGMVDRALAVARSTLLAADDYDVWVPTLFLRLKSGVIWQDDAEEVQRKETIRATKRIWQTQWFVFIILFLAILGVGTGLYFGLRPKQKEVMTGEFRIAIASFDEHGKGLKDNIGFTIADGINLRISDELQEITVGPKAEIWGPERIGTISGDTAQERTENAAKLAQEIQAYMVIYGVVEETPTGMKVTPEFYLDSDGFYEGNEVTGQYQLGSPFPLPSANNPAWSYEFNLQMTKRSDIISSMATGLSYFAVHDYEKALELFQSIEKDIEWPKNDQDREQGKEVLYAMIGFAAGKAGQYDVTETALEKAIELNPDYSRPYIGIANLNYILALQPFEESKNPADVDQALLDNCFSYLDLAVQAPEKPPLAEVDTKIHFARGQCYWLKTYTGYQPDYGLAYEEFQQVVAAYDDGANPRVRELAAESHARIGLIYQLTGNLSAAADEYQMAADLLSDIPTRQELYQKRADEIRQQVEEQPTQ